MLSTERAIAGVDELGAGAVGTVTVFLPAFLAVEQRIAFLIVFRAESRVI